MGIALFYVVVKIFGQVDNHSQSHVVLVQKCSDAADELAIHNFICFQIRAHRWLEIKRQSGMFAFKAFDFGDIVMGKSEANCFHLDIIR